MTTPKLRILALGWGVQSWTLAAMAAEGEFERPDIIIHSDTTWERSDTYAFAKEWTHYLQKRGLDVRTVRPTERTGRPVVVSATGNTYTHIPAFTVDPTTGERGKLRRQCTDHWKIRPMDADTERVMKERGIAPEPGAVEKWLGISLDEWHRAKKSPLPYAVHRYPLLELKMTRGDCILWLERHGLPVPPKSACVFCPFHSREAWQELKRRGGQDWETALRVDKELNESSSAYIRYVHRDFIPLAQAVRIPEDDGMTQLDMFRPVEDEDATCDSGYCFM
jgi:hypothetical protein